MKKFAKTLITTLCASAVLLSGTAVFADDSRETPTGISYDDIGSAIETWADENPDAYVSFVTSVFDKDEVLYEGAFGYSDRENEVAADSETVYEWGSVSKLMVWVSVMQLYEQGMIDLDKDVREYLPENFFQNLKYDEPVTMLNLMNHTAGWGETTWALQVDDVDDIVSLEQALRDTEPPQIYRPGEVCSYSNWGAALAGYIVERISGMSFADYVHENIFEPLGMEHTAILPDHSDNAWVQNKRKELVAYSTFYGTSWDAEGHELIYINLYPAGAATGTVSDMARFAQSFVSDDCPLFKHKENRDLLLSPSLYLGDTDIVVNCHGLWAEDRGDVHLLGHSGGTNSCSSNLLFDTESGLGMVFMTAGGHPEIPTLIFGDTPAFDSAGYSSSVTSPGNLAGIYAGCRSVRHGVYRIFGLFSVLPLTYRGNNTYDVAGTATLTQISDDMLVLNQNDTAYPVYVYKTSDGVAIISLGSQSFASDGTILPSIILLALFAVITVAGVFMLVFKFLGFLLRQHKHYKFELFVILSQIFRVIAILPPFFLIGAFDDQYGLTRTQGYTVAGIEVVCLVMFGVTLVISVLGLISKDSEAEPKYKYVLSIMGNILSIATILILEMVNVWGI